MLAPVKDQVGVSSITAVSTPAGCRSPNFLPPFVFGDDFHFIFGKIPNSVLAEPQDEFSFRKRTDGLQHLADSCWIFDEGSGGPCCLVWILHHYFHHAVNDCGRYEVEQELDKSPSNIRKMRNFQDNLAISAVALSCAT